jgi:hypothetical protein
MSTEASSRCLRQFFDLTESAVIEWIAPGSMEASSSNPNEVTGDAFLAPAPPGARFLKMIRGMERKYATASSRPMPKRARRASAISKRKKAEGDDGTSVAASAVATLDGAIAAGTATTQAAGHDEEDKDAGADDDEGDEDEDAKSSNESWYDMDDDFIDDSEFLDKVYKGEEDEEDEDEEENGGRLASSSGGPAAAGSGGGEGAEGVRTAMAAGRLKASGFFISRGELRSESQLEAERARQSAREAELQRSSPRKRASAAHKAGESATSDGDAVPVPGSPNRIKAAATAAAAPPPPSRVALAVHSRVWDGKWALRRASRHPVRLAARVARAQARVAEAVLPRQLPCAPTVRFGTRCAASCVCWVRWHRRVARPSPRRCASSMRACSSNASRTPRAIASPR